MRPGAIFAAASRATLLGLMLGVGAASPAASQQRYQYVIGRSYNLESLHCRTPAARDALIALWNQSRTGPPWPAGCAEEVLAFIPRGMAAGGRTLEPTARARIPVEFMVAELLSPRSLHTWIVVHVNIIRIVTESLDAPPVLQDR